MRYDYGLYIIAVLCFVLAVFIGYARYLPAYLTGSEVTDLVTMIFSAILGLVFVGLGYGVRPKKVMLPPEAPPPALIPSVPQKPTKPVTTKPKKAVKKRRPKKKT